MRIERKVFYFEEPGPQNTDDVVEAVKNRVEEGGISEVVVASDSGETALKIARAVQGKAKVVDISMRRVDQQIGAELKKSGAIVLENQTPAFRAESLVCVKRTYYTLGQGFKVAVEVVAMAAEKGLIKPYTDVIGVGGTATGADTAIVVKAAKPEEILGGDIRRRLEVREILAMPLKKKWWD